MIVHPHRRQQAPSGTATPRRPAWIIGAALILAIVAGALYGLLGAGPAAAQATCTITWTSAGGGSWHTPANWDLGRVPVATDHVCVPDLTPDVTITYSSSTTDILTLDNQESLALTGGTLSLTDTAQASRIFGTLLWRGNATLSVAGTLTVSGGATWESGTKAGDGTLRAEGGITLAPFGHWTFSGGRVENVQDGGITGAGALFFLNGATFANLAPLDHPFIVTTAPTLQANNGAGGAVINDGTFLKTGIAGTVTVNAGVRFDNHGSVEVQAGTLRLAGGGTGTDAFTVDEDATLLLGGGYTLTGSAAVAGPGNGGFVGGATTVDGTYDVDGTTTVHPGATVLVNSPVDLAGPVVLAGGTVTLANAGPSAFHGTLLWRNNATLSVAGTLTVNGAATWESGTKAGDGTLRAEGGITLAPFGHWTITGGGVENAGPGGVTGSGALFFLNGTTLTNLAGETFTITGTPVIQANNAAGGAIVNHGTLRKSGGIGTITANNGVRFDNAGAVEVQAGTLHLAGGGVGTGTFDVVSGATLQFSGYTLEEGGRVGGGGNGGFVSGTSMVRGDYDLGGTTTIHGGTVVFASPTPSPISGALLWRGNATLNVAGALTVAGAVTWENGIKAGAGTLRAAGGITLVPSGHWFITAGAVENAGDGGITGNGALFFANGTTLTNLAGATFDIRGTSSLRANNAAGGILVNQGTLMKTGSTGAVTVNADVRFDNHGSVEVQAGTLQLAGGGSGIGAFVVSQGATINFGGGYSLAGTSTVAGPGNGGFVSFATTVDGTYDVDGTTTVHPGATVLVNSPVDLAGPVVLAGGSTSLNSANASAFHSTLAWRGNATLRLAGTLTVDGATTWENGTKAGDGTLRAEGGITLAPFGHWTITGGGVENAGPGGITGSGALLFTNGATFTNLVGETFTITSAAFMQANNAAGGTFVNNGILRKVGGIGALNTAGPIAFRQGDGGTLALRIGGATSFDQFRVGGAATLGGTLDVTLINGFRPAIGDNFTVMTFAARNGGFAAVDGPFEATHNPTNVAVTYQPDPPVVDAGPDAEAEEGTPFTRDGSFVDDDSDTWTATVDYGDGDGEQPLTLDGTAFTLDHTFDDDGDVAYTVRVCVTDDTDQEDCDDVMVMVANAAPTATIDVPADPGNEGGSVVIGLSTPLDPSEADTTTGFHYAFACKNGDLSDTTYDTAGPDATATCDYDDDGAYTVKGRIFDKDDGFTEYTATVTVANLPPSATFAAPASVPEGSDFILALSDPTDPSSKDVEAGFTYDFDCGFGYRGPQPESAEACATTDDTTRAVQAKVIDKDGGEGEYSGEVAVTNVAPAVDAGPDQTVAEGSLLSASGSFADPGEDTWTVTIDYGDGTPAESATPADRGLVLNHVYANDGAYVVTVTVTDDDGGSDSDTVAITVTNVVPVVDAGADATIDAGGTFSLVGSFADPGADAWTGTVDWGDGTGEALALTGDKSFADAHVFAVAGDYTVTVTVADDDGSGSDGASVTVVAVGSVYVASVQPPINADGTSVFKANRGVVPVKFGLTADGAPTCDLPEATIAIYRLGNGSAQQVTEDEFTTPSDTGQSFRIADCQYHYNLAASALGPGRYRIDVIVDGQVVGSAYVELK